MIPDKAAYMSGNELAYMARAIDSGQLSGSSAPFRLECENWLERELNCPAKALLVNSGTSALEMAVRLCRIGPGDEVIMPSFTFTSTATAVVCAGATPVFVDIEPQNCNIDPALLEQAITPKTRAIIPVHYGGFPCEMDSIMDIAKKHGLFVIEDAAQAFLSSHGDKKLGTIGHFGCISFHESKNTQCGEGGALLVNDPAFVERAEILREKGTNREQFSRNMVDKYTWVDIGGSHILSNLQSAFLLAQLEQAAWVRQKRVERHCQYHELLAPVAANHEFRISPHEQPYPGNGHIFFIVVEAPDQKERLKDYLRQRRILAFPHYVPLHSSPFGKKTARVSGGMKHTERIADRLLRLPLYPHMRKDDVFIVSEAIKSFYLSGHGK